MIFFKDSESLLITTRPYEFNAEALDGKLSKIEETTKVAAIYHAPNKEWSYSLTQLATNFIDIIWEEYGSRAVESKPDKPTNFIGILCMKDIDKYCAQNSYRLLRPAENFNVKKEKTIVPNINPPIRSELKTTVPEVLNAFGIKLVRDSETVTHIFKSPNKK